MFKALNGLLCADVPLRNYSLTHSGCDLILRVSNYCLREWQDIWSNCVDNNLYAIYQTVGTVVGPLHLGID